MTQRSDTVKTSMSRRTSTRKRQKNSRVKKHERQYEEKPHRVNSSEHRSGWQRTDASCMSGILDMRDSQDHHGRSAYTLSPQLPTGSLRSPVYSIGGTLRVSIGMIPQTPIYPHDHRVHFITKYHTMNQTPCSVSVSRPTRSLLNTDV